MGTLGVLRSVAVLLGIAGFGIVAGSWRQGSRLVYGATGIASAVALITALLHLVAGAGASPDVVLPLGLPWIGAHFRMDALSAFSAERPRASTVSAMASTSMPRSACCRSFRRSSPG